MTAQEVLDKLKAALEETSVGVELWLPKDEYTKTVLSGKITFEEFVSTWISNV